MKYIHHAIALVTLLNVAAVAQESSTSDSAVTVKNTAQVTGTVESIDRSGYRVRIREVDGTVNEYTVSDATVYRTDGNAGKFADLHPGDTATIDFNRDNLSVERMDIIPRGSAAH